MSQHVTKKQKVSDEAETEVKVDVPKTMKALVKNKPEEGYDYVTVDVPQPAKGELLIKVDRVSICGSDINLYKWNDVAKQIAKIPFTPGHEATGTVVKVGEEVFDFKIGSRICVENHYYCGKCYQCTHDLPHICQDMGQFGHGKKTSYGGFAEYTIVPAKFAYALKSDLDPKLACLLEPFGVAQHACEEVEVKGDTVLVVGCGPIGLCSVAVAKAMGASKIIACDIVEEKLDIAKKMGADVVFNSGKEDLPTRVKSETKGDGVGALVECSGAPTFDNFFRSLRKGGRILMLGLPKVPIQVNTPLPDFIFKSITLKTIHGRKIFHTWEESEKMLSSKKVDITPIISHDLPMSKYKEAHLTLIKGEGCKILVNPHA